MHTHTHTPPHHHTASTAGAPSRTSGAAVEPTPPTTPDQGRPPTGRAGQRPDIVVHTTWPAMPHTQRETDDPTTHHNVQGPTAMASHYTLSTHVTHEAPLPQDHLSTEANLPIVYSTTHEAPLPQDHLSTEANLPIVYSITHEAPLLQDHITQREYRGHIQHPCPKALLHRIMRRRKPSKTLLWEAHKLPISTFHWSPRIP